MSSQVDLRVYREVVESGALLSEGAEWAAWQCFVSQSRNCTAPPPVLFLLRRPRLFPNGPKPIAVIMAATYSVALREESPREHYR